MRSDQGSSPCKAPADRDKLAIVPAAGLSLRAPPLAIAPLTPARRGRRVRRRGITGSGRAHGWGSVGSPKRAASHATHSGQHGPLRRGASAK
jgi:hypothetical protein